MQSADIPESHKALFLYSQINNLEDWLWKTWVLGLTRASVAAHPWRLLPHQLLDPCTEQRERGEFGHYHCFATPKTSRRQGFTKYRKQCRQGMEGEETVFPQTVWDQHAVFLTEELAWLPRSHNPLTGGLMAFILVPRGGGGVGIWEGAQVPIYHINVIYKKNK